MKTYASRRGDPSRRGTVVLGALITVFLVFALCMAFVELSGSSTRKHRHAIDQKRAMYLCEAGLAEAYAGLSIAKTGNVGSPQAPAAIGDGLFWVEANDLGGGLVELESTAMVGSGRITLGLAVQRVALSMASLGMFSNQDFATSSNTFIDGYDSSIGTYGSQVAAGTNDIAVVGSNGDVDVSSGAEIRGDVVPGPSGGVSLGSGASVTGTSQGRAVAAPLPPVEVPNIALDPRLQVNAHEPLVLPPGEYGMEALDVSGGSEVVLTGPTTAVFGEMSFATSSTLVFDNRAGPIDLYITDTLTLSSGSMASTLSDTPGMVSLQIAASGRGKVLLGADALFYGQIYAPQAEVKVLPAFELFGTLIADSVDISAQARLHHDRNTAPTRRDVLPQMWSWRVVDIPDNVAQRLGDPFQVLGLDRTLLSTPADAHQDQNLLLTYVDLNGVTQAYNGLESGFDWTQVREVLSGARDGTHFRPLPGPAAPPPGQEPEEPLSAPEQALLDLIASPATSAELSTELANVAPDITDRVLLAAINRVPPMSADDLYTPLYHQSPPMAGYPQGLGLSPLPKEVLLAAIQQAAFPSKELAWVLEQNSPLTPEVLDAALNRSPAMKMSDLNLVLRAQ